MEGLRTLDSVAYVRFASVYRNFREARDFNTLVDELAHEAGEDPGRRTSPVSRQSTSAGPGMSHVRVRIRAFMAAALALGRRGLGLCAPNPAVGALLVKDGVDFGAWLDQARRPPACGNRSLARGGRGRRGARPFT